MNIKLEALAGLTVKINNSLPEMISCQRHLCSSPAIRGSSKIESWKVPGKCGPIDYSDCNGRRVRPTLVIRDRQRNRVITLSIKCHTDTRGRGAVTP